MDKDNDMDINKDNDKDKSKFFAGDLNFGITEYLMLFPNALDNVM